MQEVPWTKSVLGGEKTTIQVSRREKSICSKFYEQKWASDKFHEQIINAQQFQWAKSVSRGG